MRKEWLQGIAGGLLCAALAAGVSNGADQVVTDKERGYEITVPEAWVVLKGGATMVALTETPAAGATQNVVVQVEVSAKDGAETLKEYVDRKHKPLEKVELKLADTSAIKVSSEEVSPFVLGKQQGIDVRDIYIVVAGKSIYTITTNVRKDDLTIYTKDIGVIIKSFKFIDAKK